MCVDLRVSLEEPLLQLLEVREDFSLVRRDVAEAECAHIPSSLKIVDSEVMRLLKTRFVKTHPPNRQVDTTDIDECVLLRLREGSLCVRVQEEICRSKIVQCDGINEACLSYGMNACHLQTSTETESQRPAIA